MAGEGVFVIQRLTDHHMAIVNAVKNTYREFVPRYSEADFKDFRTEDAGFGKLRKNSYFCIREDRRFPMELFIKGFCEHGYANLKEKQLRELSNMAENLDGTAGQKMHEFIMRDL